MTDTIVHHAKIATNAAPSFVAAVAIEDGTISACGRDDEILRLRTPSTQVIDAKGRTVIPGLNDSHLHVIRGGLNYNLKLRWDGVPAEWRVDDHLSLVANHTHFFAGRFIRETGPGQDIEYGTAWVQDRF